MTNVSAEGLRQRLRKIENVAAIARRAKMDPTQIHRLRSLVDEHGNACDPQDVRLSTLERIADALGEPLDALVGRVPSPPEPQPQRSAKERALLKKAKRHASDLAAALQKLVTLEDKTR
jgi:transcriptional regulator with XRE-family HTH domain